jgi:hypothetical protein
MGPLEVGRRVRGLWVGRFPGSVRTVWPGERVNTGGLSVWVELWTSVWARQPSRAGASEWDLVVTAQVFSRERLNGDRVWEVVELARTALERQTVVWDEGGESGVLRLFEVECEELTRREAAGWAKEFGQVVVRCAGRAEGVRNIE